MKPYPGTKVSSLLAALVLAILCGVSPANAGSRVALVIGNKGYTAAPPLSTSVADALEMDRILREKVGFETVFRRDANLATMKDALKEFEERAANAEAVFVYYSGHGLQVNDHNYLLPVEANPKKPSDVPSQTLSLTTILETLQNLPSQVKIVVVDACRKNPFATPGDNLGWVSGLANPKNENIPAGTSILLPVGPNQVTPDGDPGDLSLFTKALAFFIIEPGLELRDIFLAVRTKLRDLKGGLMTPSEYGSPLLPFYFRSPPEILGQILSGDDEVLVMVNGQESLSWNNGGSAQKPIKLRAGRNEVVIKVFNQGTYAGACNWIRSVRKDCKEGRLNVLSCGAVFNILEGWGIPLEKINEPEGWNYHVEFFEKPNNRRLESFQDREEATEEKGPRHGKMFTVATATIFVDRENNQISVEDIRRDVWRNN